MPNGAADWVQAISGVAALAVSIGVGWLALLQIRHNRRIERAYVIASPQKPGVEIQQEPFSENWLCSTSIKISNAGNTPARVLRYSIHFIVTDGELPSRPLVESQPTTVADAWLVKADYFFASGTGVFSPDTIRGVRKGDPSKKLFLIGFIDYVDRFEHGHRLWFAREFEPLADVRQLPMFLNTNGEFDESKYRDRLNLKFVRARGYNYDERRKDDDA